MSTLVHHLPPSESINDVPTLIASSLCVYLIEFRAIPIGNLLDTPAYYEGKLLTTGGEVKERMRIFGLKYYTLSDDTGEIRVVAEKALPKKGVRLRVKGNVKETFSLGEMQVLVFVEEKSN